MECLIVFSEKEIERIFGDVAGELIEAYREDLSGISILDLAKEPAENFVMKGNEVRVNQAIMRKINFASVAVGIN